MCCISDECVSHALGCESCLCVCVREKCSIGILLKPVNISYFMKHCAVSFR